MRTSTIARESDQIMPTLAGPEIGVASTKAFTTQLVALRLLTLALAIFDLVKTLFEEEVLGSGYEEHNTADPHKTMVRFLGSIIIALSIEALMLVFKFAMTEPDKLVTSLYIIGGVSMLLISLAVYIKFTGKRIES